VSRIAGSFAEVGTARGTGAMAVRRVVEMDEDDVSS
jgi:hypothetical protein